MKIFVPSSPFLLGARSIFLAMLIVAGTYMGYAAIFVVDESPAWVRLILALLLYLTAFCNLWRFGPLALNARRAAARARPQSWVLVSSGQVAGDGIGVVSTLRPGWLFVLQEDIELRAPRTIFSPSSPDEAVLAFAANDIDRVEISRRVRLSYRHLFLYMKDGREVEIEIAPKSGWTVRGARRSELEEIAAAIRGISGGAGDPARENESGRPA